MTSTPFATTDKFVAFLDVLGFKDFVRRAEINDGITFADVIAITGMLRPSLTRKELDSSGPICCPESPKIQKNVDFRAIQISDCLIVSTEISPAGMINLVYAVDGVATKLMLNGYMCRGYITRGQIYHTDNQVIGSAYIRAYEKENKKDISAFKNNEDFPGTPFVEFDPAVIDYLNRECPAVVHTMFSRMTKSDGKVFALFPFQHLTHSFTLGHTDVAREHKNVDFIRQTINIAVKKLKEQAKTADPKVKNRLSSYLKLLEFQLKECDESDRFLDECCR